MKTTMVITSFFLSLKAFGFQPVDVNSASAEQIALLPGVGQTLARNIVEFRMRHGRIAQAERLLDITGMTAKKLATIKSKIIFSLSTKKNNPPPLKPPEPILITLPKKPVINLSELEKSVLKTHGLTMNDDSSLAARVRKSALLPKLSAYFDVDRGQTTAEKFGESNADGILKRGGDKFGVGVRATFDLDKLIFNSDELEVARLSLKRLEKREEVIATLHKHYFRYLSLVETANKPLDPSMAQTVSFEMSQVEAMLDSMSMGAFTRFQSMNLSMVQG